MEHTVVPRAGWRPSRTTYWILNSSSNDRDTVAVWGSGQVQCFTKFGSMVMKFRGNSSGTSGAGALRLLRCRRRTRHRPSVVASLGNRTVNEKPQHQPILWHAVAPFVRFNNAIRFSNTSWCLIQSPTALMLCHNNFMGFAIHPDQASPLRSILGCCIASIASTGWSN